MIIITFSSLFCSIEFNAKEACDDIHLPLKLIIVPLIIFLRQILTAKKLVAYIIISIAQIKVEWALYGFILTHPIDEIEVIFGDGIFGIFGSKFIRGSIGGRLPSTE